MMISERFAADGHSVISLNKIQKKARSDFRNDNSLKKETVDCPICDLDNTEVLSEKDRYGLNQKTVICKECGLIYSNPRMDQESYKKFYEKYHKPLYLGNKRVHEDYFENQVRRGLEIKNYLKRHTELNLNNLGIVEVGCSSGGILYPFRNNNEVFGIDLIPEYVEYGREEKGLNLKVGTIDDVDFPFKPDIVIYSHTVEHLLNPSEEMAKIRNQFGDDTIVFHETPGLFSLKNSYSRDFLQMLQNAHTYYFCLQTLDNVMIESGFTPIYGNEDIRAVYKAESGTVETQGVYDEEISFLSKMEYLRHIPTKYEIKSSVLDFSKKLGMEKQLRLVHSKLFG
jgi:2-polyprenyl-3-methyl-5-hydroxy-6-metoxy-1,4-benzoquinol methylase